MLLILQMLVVPRFIIAIIIEVIIITRIHQTVTILTTAIEIAMNNVAPIPTAQAETGLIEAVEEHRVLLLDPVTTAPQVGAGKQ